MKKIHASDRKETIIGEPKEEVESYQKSLPSRDDNYFFFIIGPGIFYLFIFLLFIYAYNAWVISPPCPEMTTINKQVWYMDYFLGVYFVRLRQN
jgi:hypothetical protein